MKKMYRRLCLYEAIAFAIAVFILWLNEILDIPHFLFGAPLTPVNWTESIFESIIIASIGIIVIWITKRLIGRLKKLEGMLPICAKCKRIRNENNEWKPIEEYIRDHSDAEFTHGLCPECMQELYPDLMDPKK